MKNKILITDTLLFTENMTNLNFKHVSKENLTIQDVKSLILSENPDQDKIFLVSAGSFNITAEGCGWDHSLIQGKNKLLNDAHTMFKSSLYDLNQLRVRKGCIIKLCGLLPLPNHHDLDLCEPEKLDLCKMLSKLFCWCKKDIDKFNGGNNAVCLEKFVTKSGSKRYVTGQHKIRRGAYKDGLPTSVTQETLKRKVLIYLDQL